MSSASAKVSAPGQMTMKSWTSTRRAACAPPPKIWISGSGRRTVASPPRWRQSGRPCGGGRRVQRPPWRPRRWRCRRAGALSGVPSSAIRAGSTPAWSAASMPGQEPAAISPSTIADGARHVEAAEGRAAVAQVDRLARCRSRRRPARWRGRLAPPASRTSASTVGRPRESQTRRPLHARDLVIARHHPSPKPARPRCSDVREARRRGDHAASRRAADACACPRRAVMYSTGDLPSIAREEQRRAAAPPRAPRAPPAVSQSTPAR